MHGESFFFQAFVYLAAAVVAVPLARRLGLGSVLGYLIAGIAIGPFGLALVGSEGQDVMHFAEFGVVMMLFLIGLELEPLRLWRLRGPILGLGGLQVGVSASVLGGVSLALGLAWRPALAVGMILALSSTAIVLQTLAEKNLMRTTAGQNAFAVLLFQDLAVIPMLALLPLLAAGTGPGEGGGHGEAAAWGQDLPTLVRAALVLGVMTAIVVAGRYLMRHAFRFVARARLREVFTAAALLLVIGIALLMDRVGLSAALGTFLAGVVLANSEYRHELEASIEPFKGLLLGVFFISVGAAIDFRIVALQPGLIAALLAGLLTVKFVVLAILGRVSGMGLDQNLLFSFALAQAGEFAFVLFSFAARQGVLEEALTGRLVVVVALSMAFTPLLMLVNEKLVQPRLGTRERPSREPDEIDRECPVIIAGFGRFGHVIGRLLVANGVEATVLDNDSDQVELLRSLGLTVYYGDASRLDLLTAAGAERARLLIVATDDHQKNLEIVATARKHFPELILYARARGRTHAYDLIEAGVDHVYRETLDTALRLGIDALRRLGFRGVQALAAARTFRRHDEEALRELASMRHDRKAYLSRARERIRDLEQLLRSDLQEARTEQADAAWDTESLRREFGRPAGGNPDRG